MSDIIETTRQAEEPPPAPGRLATQPAPAAPDRQALLKLNLGCGQNKQAGYVNVDKFDTFAPEVVWDLETFPWPFQADQAGEVLMHHVLEHMGASVDVFLSIMKELYRVCAPGAQVYINVPHPRGDGFAGDPTHVRPVTPTILSLFSKKNNEEWRKRGWPNTPLGFYLDVDFELQNIEYRLMPRWLEKLRLGHVTREQLDEAVEIYYNVIDEIRMVLQVRK